ncbi:MAG: histidine kinase [Bacteroidota bacterium]
MSLLNVGIIVYERLASRLELEIPFYFINEFTGGFTALLLMPFLIYFFHRYPLSPIFPRLLVYLLVSLAYGILFTSVMYASRVPLYHLAGITRLHEIFNDLPYRYLMEYFKQLVDFFLIYTIFWGINQYKANKNQEIKALHMEQELVKAQLSSLQMQLQPHFFFNTLNVISNTMYKDPAQADRIISRLGSFLRKVMQLKDRPLHRLEEEIELLSLYTHIMEARYPNTLQVCYQVDPTSIDIEVPVLLLQPLVENAIQYSVGITDQAQVTIASKKADGRLTLEVADNGPGIALGEISYGTGLQSVLERLEKIYAGEHDIQFGKGELGGLSVSIQLPFHG